MKTQGQNLYNGYRPPLTHESKLTSTLKMKPMKSISMDISWVFLNGRPKNSWAPFERHIFRSNYFPSMYVYRRVETLSIRNSTFVFQQLFPYRRPPRQTNDTSRDSCIESYLHKKERVFGFRSHSTNHPSFEKFFKKFFWLPITHTLKNQF